MADTTPEDDALLTAVADGAAEASAAREEFEKAIRAAHPRWSFQQIAVAAGLSKPRIHQIVREGDTP